MSREFIEKRTGRDSIEEAESQQRQLSYFTTSKVQKQVTEKSLKAWIERKYITDDHFINWIKTIFKTDNFLSFYKYCRNPNASAKLINNRIKEPLSRVFYSEDGYFNYVIRGKSVDEPKELQDGFEKQLFEKLLYRHNDIIVHDLKGPNEPYRQFVEINNVVAIEVINNKISQIAYTASVMMDDKEYMGYVYLNDDSYIFYTRDYTEIINEPHDLGYCPAHFITHENFGDNQIVKKSMFSYLRADLEEYVFLKTLQRMTEPNGAIPVVTQLNTKAKGRNGTKANDKHEPMGSTIGGKQSKDVRENVSAEGSVLQAGTIVKVDPIKNATGDINMDVVKNLVNFHYIPIEALDYLKGRILEIEQNLIISILGDYSESNEEAKNELQVSKSYVSKEDKLRWLGDIMSHTRTNSDLTMLGLKYGINSVEANIFYGSDFFLETQKELYSMFENSPNNIERKNILSRLAKSRNRNNKEKALKESILYLLLPYASDKDFQASVKSQMVDPITFQLQTRFNYWIAMWEAQYGSITVFWNDSDQTDSEKLVLLNKLIEDLISSNINLKDLENGKKSSKGATT